MSINIVEVTWKGKLKEAFPDPNAYSAFMGNFSTATGYATFQTHIRPATITGQVGYVAPIFGCACPSSCA